ncbi:MAG: hypothetical protein NTU95_01085 [Methanothrix sp.]|nr:hypothetical protein [Methanothrix sp.]
MDEENEIETEENESEESEGPIDIRIITNDELGTKDFIDIYVINRNHIREQSKSVIPACGFLLTGAFGLIYFIFIDIDRSIFLQIGNMAIYKHNCHCPKIQYASHVHANRLFPISAELRL